MLPASPLIGKVISSYEVLSAIGRGGMAEVYLGKHTSLARTAAIKVLPADLSAQSDYLHRFERAFGRGAQWRHRAITARRGRCFRAAREWPAEARQRGFRHGGQHGPAFQPGGTPGRMP